MDKSSVIKGGVAFLLLAGLAAWRIVDERPPQAPQSAPETASQSTSAPQSSAPNTAAAPAPNGKLQITDSKVGSGAVAKAGQPVTVHYRGTLTDGQEFDASYNRGEPFTFNLGGGEVIKGWDQGVAGMKVGGKRKLTIPPALGYGARAMGNAIPANSTLVFEVELLKVG